MEKFGYRRGQAISLDNIGLQYYHLGDYEKALEYCSMSLKISEDIGDRASQAIILNNIALVYDCLGDYQKAFEYYNKSLQISREIGDRRSETFGLSNIGGIYYYLNDFSKSLEYYTKSLKILIEVGDRSGQIHSFITISQMYLEMYRLHYYIGHYRLGIKDRLLNKAREYLLQAEKRCKEKKDEKETLMRIYICYVKLALIDCEKIKKKYKPEGRKTKIGGFLKRAKIYAKKAMQLALELNSKLGCAEVLLLMAKIEAREEKSSSSKGKFKKAIKIYEELQQQYELAQAYYYYGEALLNFYASARRLNESI